MNNIPRGTKVTTLLNYLLKPKMGLYEPPIAQADVHCAAIITHSRLDDELSVATISFAITPLWLHFLMDDPYGLPKKTPLGTLWAGVDRNAIDLDGQTAFIKAVKQDEEDLLFAEMLAEFDDTDVNIQDHDGMTALHWACTVQRPAMVQLCLSVPDCVTGLRDTHGRTAFDIAASTDHGAIPDLFYRNIMEIEAESPQSALLRLLTITSEPNNDAPTFPGIALFDPVEESNERLVLALIDRGIDLTARNADGDTALHVAAGKGNIVIGTAIVNAGSDVNSRGNGGATPLHHAAATGNAEMVDAILAAGADMTDEDNDGNSAVQLAEQNNHFRIAQVLKTHRTVLVSKRETGATVAQQAEGGEDTRDIQVDGGPVAAVVTMPNSDNVSAPDDSRAVADGRSGLRYGAEKKEDRILKDLLQVALAGGNDGRQALQDLAVSVRPSQGEPSWKALHLAVKSGDLEMCRMLLAAAVDIDLYSIDVESVLHLAVDTAEIEMVKLILASGHSVRGTNGNGWTALHCAASCRFSHIIAGGSVDKSTTTAIELGTQMVRILLSAGAKVNATGSRGITALHLAAESGGLEMVGLLLERGAFIEALDYEHYTPLHRASFNGHASVVARLLLHGARIEARTRIVSKSRVFAQVRKQTERVWPKRASTSGYTAFHIAASCGNTEVVRILLQHGAVFNSDSVDGTPRQLAGGHPDVIALLDTGERNHNIGTGSSPRKTSAC